MCRPHVLLMVSLVCLPFLSRVVVCCLPDCSAEQAVVNAAILNLLNAMRNEDLAHGQVGASGNAVAAARATLNKIKNNPPAPPEEAIEAAGHRIIFGGALAVIGAAAAPGATLGVIIKGAVGIVGGTESIGWGARGLTNAVLNYHEQVEAWKQELEAATQAWANALASFEAAEQAVETARLVAVVASQALIQAFDALTACQNGY